MSYNFSIHTQWKQCPKMEHNIIIVYLTIDLNNSNNLEVIPDLY